MRLKTQINYPENQTNFLNSNTDCINTKMDSSDTLKEYLNIQIQVLDSQRKCLHTPKLVYLNSHTDA